MTSLSHPVSLRSPPASLSKEQLRVKAAMAAAMGAMANGAAAASAAAAAARGLSDESEYGYGYDDDADSGNHVSKEEERERKKAIQARIRKEQAEGPPPDMAKRSLIFDSLSKIISRTFGKGSSRSGAAGASSTAASSSSSSSGGNNANETRGTYLFTWGAGYHGQLGRQFQRGRKKYATLPQQVHLDIPIRQISCGGLHTAAVTDQGLLYTWGDARSFQLGYQPHGFTNQPVPRLVSELEGAAFVVSVACGQAHTVCLTDKGSLWSWGVSKFGQCGHNDRQLVKSPRKIRMEDPSIRFAQVSAGDKHSMALSTKGVVYGFGSCQQGQGGFDESPPVDKLRPTEVRALSDAGVIVSSVVCGSIHTCMVTDEGSLYLCGFGEHFYPQEEQNFFYRPVRVPFNEKVVQVACGQSHIIVLTAGAEVYTFGSGGYGQLGQGVKGDLNTPRLVLTGKNIAQVAAGRYHSVALTSFGTLYTWGCGENGQLGHLSDESENILFPRVLEPNLGTVVGQVACGEHHTAVLTSTPWTKADAQVMEWLRAEREEYALKCKFIKRSNHGLVKKDLIKIQERMAQLKAEWAAEAARAGEREMDELVGHVESVKGRQGILAEMAEEHRMREERHNAAAAAGGQAPGAQGHGHASAAGAAPASYMHDESKESGHDPMRPESAGRAGMRIGGGGSAGPFVAGSQTARVAGPSYGKNPAFGATSAGLTAPRRPQQAAPHTARLGNTVESAGGPTLPALASTVHVGAGSGGGVDVLGSNAARATFLRESASMVRRMKGIIADSGDASTEARLRKNMASVFSYRKDYDSLRNLTRKRMRLLEAIQRKVASLRKNSSSSTHRRRIHALLLKALQMKLSTVSIKITETEENRRNYALNIAHLKEEELERFYQLEALRKQVNENDVFTRKVNEMKLSACEEASKAEGELHDFRSEIAQFHSFIHDQLSKFKQLAQVAQARRLERENEKAARSAKNHEKINVRIQRLQAELSDKNSEAASMSSQLESVQERLRYFEKRFQQIASATGLTDPQAIINKFGLKEEMRRELQAEIAAKTQALKQMRAELEVAKAELAEAQAGFQESKWKDVDALYKLVHDSQAQATHNQSECDRLEERLAYYKEGMLALLSLLPEEVISSSGDASQSAAPGAAAAAVDAHALLSSLEGGDMGHEQTMQLISLLGSKLLGLASLVEEGESQRVERAKEAEETRRQQEAAHQARLAQEIAEKLHLSSMLRRAAPQQQQQAAESSYDDAEAEAEEDQEEADTERAGEDEEEQEEEEGQEEEAEEEQRQQQQVPANEQSSSSAGDMQRTQQRQDLAPYADQQYQMAQY